jgi:uncharacterized protein
MSSTILTALGLVLVIEGLTYALVPAQLKRMMAGMLSMTDEQMRIVGTVVLAAGVVVVWVARSIFG